jgi:hypothetical protein
MAASFGGAGPTVTVAVMGPLKAISSYTMRLGAGGRGWGAGSGLRAQGSGLRAQGLGFRAYDLCSKFRVWGPGFKLQGMGLRVQGPEFGV